MKGVRFTPKNYSDEVEAKIQHYKKEGYKPVSYTHLTLPTKLEV